MAAPAAAQVLYGSLVGTVEDPSGSVVPNATVTITNKQTGVTREAASDDRGRFSIGNLLPGRYDLKVTSTGFRPEVHTDIEVTINTVTRRDIKLEVGGTAETVTVAASALSLQTDKSDVRSEITTTALINLPLPNYRNYQSLINLVPGATPADFQNAVVDTPARALTTNINGTARNNNNTLTDGAVNIFIWLPHHTVYVAPVESIENVNITTGSFDAEQGMAGGAAITVFTKSGTNQLHGSGFWFHNNQHLSSGPYFRTSTFVKPLTIFNQGGGTIGGPIKKDKLFYFFSFEKTWERTGNSGNYSVAPPEFREGDFSKWLNNNYARVYDPATSSTPAERQMFPNNIVPKSRFNPIFDSIQRQLPLPNQISPTDPNNLGGNYFGAGTLKLDRNNYDVKVNWNATGKLVIWSSYSRMDAPVKGLYLFGDLGGPALGTHGFGDTTTQLPRAGFTYSFSPTLLMDGVFGYSRFDQFVDIPNSDKNIGLDVWKIPGTNGGRQYASDKRYGGPPPIAGFGFSNVGVDATWAPLTRNDRSYTYQTNFSKLMGPHELRWGFEPRRHEMNHWQPETGQPRGAINFGSGATIIPGVTGREPNSFASALLGLVSNYSKSIQFLLMQTREWQLSWYVRDRWQVNRNLTLTLGLRYEYYPLINRGDRGIERWNPYTNVVTLGGIGNVPRENGITVSKKLFAPRIGFAYRMGDSWVVRSGYGITYDPLPFSRPLRGLYPATLTGGWSAGDAAAAFRESSYGWFNTLNQGIPDVPIPDTGSGTLLLPLNVDMGPRSPWGGQINRGYIQSWNFIVERRLPLDIIANAGYVATRTVHQLLDRNINTAGPGSSLNLTANLPLGKLYGRTNSANMWDGIGDGSYHALQASLNKNFGHGLFLKGAYTWSKTLNMADDDGWAGLAFSNWEPELRRNYAPAGYDRRHMFTMAWAYELPVGRGKRLALTGLADKVLGGWQISGIFSAYTGTPFTVSGSGTAVRCVGCPSTADQIAPVRRIDQERGPGKPYYDPNSFRDPLFYFNAANPVYREGTMGRNVLYGPGFWRLDPMVSKQFVVTERVRAEFRAEAFNLTNTPRWSNPNSGSANMQLNPDGSIRALNNFMTITGAGGLRTVRFGMRVQF
ncbi:MAG: TonB-dependent receptor [Acidobacteria bacterium]|nr:TonB-dependent receptor [Acidobacteriota bacterium]